MKNRFYLLFFLSLIFAGLQATDISGEVSGRWTLLNSPYNVIGDVLVPAGQQLTIDPGVQVIFQGNYRLTIQGQISAIGTEADSIRFIGTPSINNWDSIRLETGNNQVSLTHCVFLNADTAVHIINSYASITFCRIGFSNKGIDIFGIGSHLFINIENNYIHDIVSSGIQILEGYLYGYFGHSIRMLHNKITRCGSGTGYVGAIHLSNQTIDGFCNPMISWNHIYNNYKQGITAWDITNNSRVNPGISYNLIENNLTGIYFIHTSGSAWHNIIRNNFIPGDSNSGAGFMISGASSIPAIAYNIITGNYTGFYIIDNASPFIGASPGGDDDQANMIFNNIDPSGIDWSIYLFNTTANINAQYNRFTTIDPALIAASIYDSNDNTALGTVDFTNFWTDPIIKITIPNHFYGELTTFHGFTILNFHTINPDGIIGSRNPKIPNFKDFYTMEPAGSYLLTANTLGSELLYGVYGGYGDPIIINAGIGEIITDIEFYLASVDQKIVYGEVFTHLSRELFPISFYHDTYKYRDQQLFLHEEGDFLYVYGERKINPDLMQWEDVFLEQPEIYMKVRNLVVHNTWESPYTGWSIVRNISEQVQIDRVTNVGGVNMVIERLFYTPNVGLTEHKKYSPLSFNIQQSYSCISAPLFTNPSSIMPLEGTREFIYEELHEFLPLLSPTSFTIFENGFMQWDPPRVITVPNDGVTYRVYKNDQIFATVDYRQFYLLVNPDVLAGTWYVVQNRYSGESAPSNIVTFTSEIEENISPLVFSVLAYPNPVNLSAGQSLNFDFKQTPQQTITLEVFNIRGQKVATLMDGLPDKSDFSMSVNNSQLKALNLASGVYFYRLDTGNEVITRKILILK